MGHKSIVVAMTVLQVAFERFSIFAGESKCMPEITH